MTNTSYTRHPRLVNINRTFSTKFGKTEQEGETDPVQDLQALGRQMGGQGTTREPPASDPAFLTPQGKPGTTRPPRGPEERISATARPRGGPARRRTRSQPAAGHAASQPGPGAPGGRARALGPKARARERTPGAPGHGKTRSSSRTSTRTPGPRPSSFVLRPLGGLGGAAAPPFQIERKASQEEPTRTDTQPRKRGGQRPHASTAARCLFEGALHPDNGAAGGGRPRREPPPPPGAQRPLNGGGGGRTGRARRVLAAGHDDQPKAGGAAKAWGTQL